MTKKKETDKTTPKQVGIIKEHGLPEHPKERIERGLPARFHIWETPTSIVCHIWWGREQTAGRRLYLMSTVFPWPNRILKGCGIFEEILSIFKSIAVEIYVAGPKWGPKNEYDDYAKALEQIEKTAVSAIISGGIYDLGRSLESVDALVTSVDFQKK